MQKLFTSMILLGAILIGAPTPGLSQQQPPQQQPPTATELFALRSECAQLGRKMLDRIVSETGGEGPPFYNEFSQKSKYDSVTGHCYVEIDVRFTHPSAGYSRGLYDGQTGEELASLVRDKEKLWGEIHDKCLGCSRDAESYIDRMMSENR